MRAQLEDYQRQTVEFEQQYQAIKDDSDKQSERYFDIGQQYNTAL